MPKIAREVPEGVPFYGPKSLCSCGHTGDGILTQHHDSFSPGHAECKVKDCLCAQFTWVAWTPEFKKLKGLK
jgi:hypothetical protein